MRICGMWLIVCLARGRTMCVFLFFFLFAYNMFCVFNCWSYRNVREMREIFVWGGTKGIWFVCFIIWTIATDLLSNLHLHFMINDHSKWTLEFARVDSIGSISSLVIHRLYRNSIWNILAKCKNANVNATNKRYYWIWTAFFLYLHWEWAMATIANYSYRLTNFYCDKTF